MTANQPLNFFVNKSFLFARNRRMNELEEFFIIFSRN